MKRKRYMDNLNIPSYKIRKKRVKSKFAPSINSIENLIELGQSINLYENIDMVMLWRILPYLEELNNLIGMKNMKDSIFNQILYYIQGMHLRNTDDEYLHTIIYGCPGTGKTTVAKIIAKIYKSMGILSKNGIFKIAHRDDFVAGYLGQTAIKTQKLLESCIGGVLFIDEVYSLGSGQDDKDSFSKEAIDTIVSFLSEHTKDFCCIAAGYEEDIDKCFFSMNAGLESRFQWKHFIDKYNPQDLFNIFISKIQNSKWETTINEELFVKKIQEHLDSLFKNMGRDILSLISKCKIVHSRRVFGLDSSHKFIITEEDLNNALNLMKKNVKIVKKDLPPEHFYI